MPTYTIHAAKTNLSKLVARAEAGEEIVLARGKDPVAVAELVPVASKGKRKFGAMRDLISIGPEFVEPLPKEELKYWK